MLDLYTPDQVRGMDRRAYDRGVQPADLMEAAARHVARWAVRAGGHAYGLRVALLCGKGNNGGDGFAAARHLLRAGAHPLPVSVDAEPGVSVVRERGAYRTLGGRVASDVASALASADVAVDCLLGTGAKGEPHGAVAAAIAALDGFQGAVVACDLPSGVDADTGAVPGVAVRADVTVTLGAGKRGLWLWPAAGRAGRVVVADLGIVDGHDVPVARMLEASDIADAIRPVPRDADKRGRGAVLIVAGAAGMGGAAVLSARGALSAGAGLVVLATGDREVIAASVPEAVTIPLDVTQPEDALGRLAAQLTHADAVVVGPGLGIDEGTQALVRELASSVEVPLVLDADGINAFRHDAAALVGVPSELPVLTPHARELVRLTGDDSAYEQRATSVPALARRLRAVVVAKGAGTLVAAPDGRTWINPTGGPALATGGTGDVLAGALGALLAQDGRIEAVPAGVWLHGRAGDLAAERHGIAATTATHVAEAFGWAEAEIGR